MMVWINIVASGIEVYIPRQAEPISIYILPTKIAFAFRHPSDISCRKGRSMHEEEDVPLPAPSRETFVQQVNETIPQARFAFSFSEIGLP
jgi:hypothetical protein